jgi:hypothetical protein
MLCTFYKKPTRTTGDAREKERWKGSVLPTDDPGSSLDGRDGLYAFGCTPQRFEYI